MAVLPLRNHIFFRQLKTTTIRKRTIGPAPAVEWCQLGRCHDEQLGCQVFLEAPKPLIVDVEGGKKAVSPWELWDSSI